MIDDGLRSQMEALSSEERRELLAFLAHMAVERETEFSVRIRRRMADESPESWIAVDQR
jgi:DNA primase catalytic subunit